MRIDRLDLIAYGVFTDTSLDLSAGDFGLHLIYGDNEAGKSTTLRALTAWLFGISARTTDNFLHSNPQLRIGGRLRLCSGAEIEFSRRKGTKATLLQYSTDEPLDESRLTPFLPSGIDENIFRQLWGIDHAGLLAGGRELLEQSGDLGQALFSAAVGTANLRQVLTDLQGSAEEIFKPRGSKASLNQAISNFRDAQKKIKEAILPVSDWKHLQKNLSDTEDEIAQVEQQIDTKSRTKHQLERVRRVNSTLAQRRNMLDHLTRLGQVLLLPEDFEDKHRNARDKLQAAGETRQRLEAKLESLNRELQSLHLRTDLLENEEAILSLYKELGAVETMLNDRPPLDGNRRLLRHEAEQLLKSIRPDLPIDHADTMRPLLNNKRRISELVQQHSLLTKQKQLAESALRENENRRQSLQSELDSSLESPLDLKGLKATIAAARKAGDVEQRLAEAAKRTAEEIAACDTELARLGRYSGQTDQLLHLPLPVLETLDGFEKDSDRLLEEAQNTTRKLQEVEAEKKQSEQELKTLLLKTDVPTVADLENSRQLRNAGWRLIRQKYIEQKDVAQELSGYAPAPELPTVYEKHVEQADHISDRLRLEADQVVKRVELESRIDTLQQRADTLTDQLRKLEQAGDAFQARWVRVWEPLGIDPGTPREMKQWLIRAEKLVEKIQAAKGLSADERNIARVCQQLQQTVSDQVSTVDPSADTRQMSLEALISLCEQRAEEEEAARERRRAVALSLKQCDDNLKKAREDAASADTELSGWTGQWRQAIDGLGLQPDVPPGYAAETFDRLLSFFDTFDRSEELRERLYDMDQVKERFDAKVREFAAGIGWGSLEQEPSVIAAQLQRDLNTARETRASLIKIEAQCKEIQQEMADATITIRHSDEQLAALREHAGVDSNEQLTEAGEKSRRKRDLMKHLERLEQELSRNGDGLSIDELEKESETAEADTLEAEIEKISIELKELQQSRDKLRDQRQTLQNEIQAKDGSALAATASEDAEEQIARMGSDAEQYLRLQIASLILEQRIEYYRKTNQAPVMSRAGDLFSRLTLGSYTGLRDELAESGKPILLGVRQDGSEVAVEGMSDGSRDQLYLALRLATLEQHLTRAEPMPFVVDDILIGFDDSRTRVCLEVLAELAAQTQVLLFTHHRRVIELAAPLNAKAGVFIHELDSQTVSRAG